jgi:hypothetical protein
LISYIILQKIFTASMMENRFMTKGKDVLLPFPFDDLSTLKV